MLCDTIFASYVMKLERSVGQILVSSESANFLQADFWPGTTFVLPVTHAEPAIAAAPLVNASRLIGELAPQIKEREGLRGNRFHRRPERSDCFGLSLFRRATLNWTSDYDESR
jgi:hypothetical protein